MDTEKACGWAKCFSSLYSEMRGQSNLKRDESHLPEDDFKHSVEGLATEHKESQKEVVAFLMSEGR